jgi:streptogramin lyase
MRRVALVVGILALAMTVPATALADVPYSITQILLEEVPGRTSDVTAEPSGIASGPEGNLFITETDGNNIVRMTAAGTEQTPVDSVGERSGPFKPGRIVLGPDHLLWIQQSHGRISRMPPGGGVEELEDASIHQVEGLTAGPGGEAAIWFCVPEENEIGRVTTAASPTFTTFPTGISSAYPPFDITAGPDGNLWFTDPGAGAIGRITPAGVTTEFTAGITAGAEPTDIAAGPEGNLWFIEQNENAIGRITTTGVVTQFKAGITAGAQPDAIVAGPDESMWFTEPGIGAIGQITRTGTVTQYTSSSGIPAGTELGSIIEGPDGNIWFTEPNQAAVGRLVLGPTNTEPPALTGNTSAPTPGGSLTTDHGAWSLAPTSFEYQWQRSSGGGTFTDIPGATGTNYTVSDEDIGDALRIRVTAPYLGTAVSAYSTATGTTVPADPTPGPTVYLPGPTVTVQISSSSPPPSTSAEPRLTVSGKPSIAKGTKFVVSCAAACKVSGKLTVKASSAKKYKLGSATTLGTVSESVLHAGSLDLTVKLTAAVKKKLAGVDKLPATLQVSVLDAGGASKILTVPITLAR